MATLVCARLMLSMALVIKLTTVIIAVDQVYEAASPHCHVMLYWFTAWCVVLAIVSATTLAVANEPCSPSCLAVLQDMHKMCIWRNTTFAFDTCLIITQRSEGVTGHAHQ